MLFYAQPKSREVGNMWGYPVLQLYLNVRLKNQFWLIDMAAFEVAHLVASPASPPSQVFMNKAHHSEQREANKFQDLSTEQRKNQKHTLCKYA